MEEINYKKWEQVSLIKGELMRGKEQAQKLCDHLLSSSSSSSHETNEALIDKILTSYEKALTMLNWRANMGENINRTSSNGNMMDSYYCSKSNGSPRSEVLDQEVKHKDVFKKRKTMPKWTEQVKVWSGTALEGSLDDGYSWRKYGQKDILGTKHPRGYYRCTHRNVQGCLATKQVQKSDEDPTILEITYKGRHTCTQASHSNKALFSSKKNMVLEENHKDHTTPQKKNLPPPQEKTEQPQEKIFNFGSDPEVKTEEFDTKEEDIFPSFCFLSPSIGSENDEDNINKIFSDTMIENQYFMESFSPASLFISPETSETNIFCLSPPCHLDRSSGLGLSVQTSSESDINEIASVTNSPLGDLDVLLDMVDFDTDFPINTPDFFSW